MYLEWMRYNWFIMSIAVKTLLFYECIVDRLVVGMSLQPQAIRGSPRGSPPSNYIIFQ
jgi:hypothetical protein